MGEDAPDRTAGAMTEFATDGGDPGMESEAEVPSDAAVVEAAAEAAEGLVFSRYRRSDVEDLDVTVRFENGTLEVDVYLTGPDDPPPSTVATEAVEAAEAAVDELFADADAE